MNHFDELNTLHFSVDVRVREIKSGGWEATGIIIRKDTGENVQGGTTVFSENRETALGKLFEQLKVRLNNMVRPYDWENPDKVRQIISKYIHFNEQITNRYMSLENERSNNILTKDTLHKACHEIRKKVSSTTINILNELNRFSEEDKIRLMTPDNNIYQNIVNPWNLDEIYARETLFAYIIDPSDSVKNAHNELRNRMISAFDSSDNQE
jgi:uncharacterized protein YaaR (DUF327 family)